MAITLAFPEEPELRARITVFGVGGAGGNAVNNMITAGLRGVEFVVANTDAQALTMSKSERLIQLGAHVTEGLGAGSQPEVGRAAAEECIDEIIDRRVSPRWSLARLATLDRALLRIGTYELLEHPDRSQAVIINEAVVLARRFGTDDSPRFVNGVLAAVAEEVRGNEPPG